MMLVADGQRIKRGPCRSELCSLLQEGWLFRDAVEMAGAAEV